MKTRRSNFHMPNVCCTLCTPLENSFQSFSLFRVSRTSSKSFGHVCNTLPEARKGKSQFVSIFRVELFRCPKSDLLFGSGQKHSLNNNSSGRHYEFRGPNFLSIVHRYIKKLQESIKGKTPEELKSEENQIKITALKTTSNISTLIRDLFHSPPSFKSLVNLSWVTKAATNNQQVR